MFKQLGSSGQTRKRFRDSSAYRVTLCFTRRQQHCHSLIAQYLLVQGSVVVLAPPFCFNQDISELLGEEEK